MAHKKDSDKIIPFIFGGVYLLFCVGACCLAAFTIISIPTLLQFPALQPLDEYCVEADCLNACMYQLPDIDISIINSPQGIEQLSEYVEIARYKQGPAPEEIISTRSPVVPEYLQTFQDDLDLHRKIWQYYQKVFPVDKFTKVDYLIIYTDGRDGRTAAQVWNVGGSWQLYVDVLDFKQPDATRFLIHEYGHTITLSDLQSSEVNWHYTNGINEEDFQRMDDLCNSFFNGINCAKPNSYLDQFGVLFWADVYPEWKEIFIQHGNDEDAFRIAIKEFYIKYSDQFVSDYAPTNPREDIAESWTEFVLSPKPTGTTIADQKILFFYQFPELVEARTTIIQKTCQFAIEQQQP